MTFQIRPEVVGDAADIAVVLEHAFGGSDEARLLERLRAGGELALSLVALADGRIVGQVAFSQAAVELPGRRVRVAWLAPLAVAPAQWGQGIGSALVQDGLGRIPSLGVQLAVVVGDPRFYGRFGFSVAAARPLRSRWPARALQAIVLNGQGTGLLAGALIEPAAFAALE